MYIRKIKTEEINPAAYNSREDLQPNDPAYRRIEASIDGFELLEPFIWNRRTKNLIGGHQRLKVLIQKGYTEVYASVMDLDPEREKALSVALNKVSGLWDMDKIMAVMGPETFKRK